MEGKMNFQAKNDLHIIQIRSKTAEKIQKEKKEPEIQFKNLKTQWIGKGN